MTFILCMCHYVFEARRISEMYVVHKHYDRIVKIDKHNTFILRNLQ